MPTQAAADVAALKVKVEDAKKKARAFEAATCSPHGLMRYVLCDVLPDEDVNAPLVENLFDAPPQPTRLRMRGGSGFLRGG